MPNIIILLSLICLSLVQIACQSHDRNSILVLAVDDLSFADVNCNPESDDRSGLAILCKESVRFTHAFTPSTLTNPTMTSLLTGMYPLQHGIHHNGAPGLKPEFETVAEVALKRNYRTGLFSGGAPLFRKSGLNQGFELFEDNITPNFNLLFRPFQKNTENFLQWLEQDLSEAPFFAVIYVPDLAFINTETFTELGEARNLSYESQMDEFDESLGRLIQSMKKKNHWEKTTVILAGLNGHASSSRLKQFPPLNVHSENTQVALLIKPAQNKKRDEPISWKIDRNVSLVDVGQTLYELVGENPESPSSDFPVFSLLNSLKNSMADLPEERPLLIESGWGLWRQATPLRTALLSHFVLYINDERPLLFNTLVDRFETNPLPLLQQSILPITQKLQALTNKYQLPSFTGLNKEWQAKVSIPFARWMRPGEEPLLLRDLKRLSQQNPESLDLLNWTAQIALNQKDWPTLKALGEKHKVHTWAYVGGRNINDKNIKAQDSCFALLTLEKIEARHLKDCSDPLFLELIDWLRADVRGLSKESQRKRFERSFRNYMLDQHIQRTNIATGMLWDVARDNVYSPSRTELALSFPENSKVRAQAYKSLTTVED